MILFRRGGDDTDKLSLISLTVSTEETERAPWDFPLRPKFPSSRNIDSLYYYYYFVLPYSGKSTLVQTFVLSPVTPSERNLHSFNFRVFTVLRPHPRRQLYMHQPCVAIGPFAVLIFAVANPSAQNSKFCTTQKFHAIWYFPSPKWYILGSHDCDNLN